MCHTMAKSGRPGYHPFMSLPTAEIVAWSSTMLLAASPWLVLYFPILTPLALAAAVFLEVPWRGGAPFEPWRSCVVVTSASVAVGLTGGWGTLGAWALLALVTAAVAWLPATRGGSRPDAADVVVLLGWAGAFAIHPHAMSPDGGGWLAPLLALIAVRRIVEALGVRLDGTLPVPGPPSREVRGSLELRDGVLGDKNGAIRSVPVHLTLAAGESVAVLCDDPGEAAMLAETLAGRRRLVQGSLLIDGEEVADGGQLVTVIGPGEPFLVGSVEENLAALTGGVLGRGELAAIEEACSMDEVRREGAGQTLAADGAPLSVFHRLLVLAARVIPSHYRIVVVVDPAPWVNLVRAEVWRAAVVRASVGRTAMWLTADRGLAARADRALAWRHGNLVLLEARRGDES